MIVIPAIDLRGGQCVRLVQGDYDRETVFSENPIDVAQSWEAAGAKMLHVVDLDGAREGMPVQRDVIAAIVRSVTIPVQVGGGIRTFEHAAALVDAGVERIVIGTAAVETPALVERLLAGYGPERIIAGVDARNGMVATRGWIETSAIAAEGLINQMRDQGVQRVVYTDIDRDGTLSEPNFDATERVAQMGVSVIASGGVARHEHLERLAVIRGVEAVIVGRALYTRDIVLHGPEWEIGDGRDHEQREDGQVLA